MSQTPNPDLETRGQDHGGLVRTMFDRIAPTYDLVNSVLSAGLDRRWRRRAVAALGDDQKRLLDSCAGTMDTTALVADRFPNADVVALDFSAEMLERGRSKAPRASTLVGDALALPFDDASFTGIICAFGVRNLSDVPSGLREARRVLAPGGTFVILEFCRPERLTGRLFAKSYSRVVLPAVGGVLSKNRDAYAYLSKSMAAFMTRRDLEDACRNAGFASATGSDLRPFGIASIVVGRA